MQRPTFPTWQVVYARLILLPWEFCIEYSFDCIPMVTSLLDARNLVSAALLAALLAVAVTLLRACRSSACARATMGASAWLLLPWLPVSHLFLRLGTLVAERTMYLPSFGALLLIAHLLRPSRAAALPVGVGVGYLAATTLSRTLDWRTDDTAFEAAIRVCPTSAKLNQQLCTLRTNADRLDEAAAHCAVAEKVRDVPTHCRSAPALSRIPSPDGMST